MVDNVDTRPQESYILSGLENFPSLSILGLLLCSKSPVSSIDLCVEDTDIA
jgi:hypothetical protein